jgi:hypothetical protein
MDRWNGEDAIGERHWMARSSGVETRLYPSPTSDIVALLVFDHQGHAMNLHQDRMGNACGEADGTADAARRASRADR